MKSDPKPVVRSFSELVSAHSTSRLTVESEIQISKEMLDHAVAIASAITVAAVKVA